MKKIFINKSFVLLVAVFIVVGAFFVATPQVSAAIKVTAVKAGGTIVKEGVSISNPGAPIRVPAFQDQIITFNPLRDRIFGYVDFSVVATASSGLPVTFTATGNCTVTSDGFDVHVTGAGSCTITAHQAGNLRYLAADPVSQSFPIAKAFASIAVTSYRVAFNGLSHTATATILGVDGASLNEGILDLSGTTHTNVGTYNRDPWTFTDTAGNYRDVSGTVNDSITSGGNGGGGSTVIGGGNITPTEIPGCGLRTTGFSTITGQSCKTNIPHDEGQVLGAEKFYFTLFQKIGSSGNETMELQKFLNLAGFGLLAADGKFGPLTRESTIRFQLANGLKGDGLVGSLTRAVLNK